MNVVGQRIFHVRRLVVKLRALTRYPLGKDKHWATFICFGARNIEVQVETYLVMEVLHCRGDHGGGRRHVVGDGGGGSPLNGLPPALVARGYCLLSRFMPRFPRGLRNVLKYRRTSQSLFVTMKF